MNLRTILRTDFTSAKERIPNVLFAIRDFVIDRVSWNGSATALLQEIGDQTTPVNKLTQMIVPHVKDYFLPAGIKVEFRKEAKIRRIILTYDPSIIPKKENRESEEDDDDDGSDGSDGSDG